MRVARRSEVAGPLHSMLYHSESISYHGELYHSELYHSGIDELHR